MKKIIFKTENMIKSYDNEALIIKDMNVEIYEGDFTVVMGNSGSGKSTFLYCLSGMDKITNGKVKFLDKDISKIKEDKLAILRRNKMGFVFQQANFIPNLSIYENIIIAGYVNKENTKKNVKEKALKLLKEFGIYDLKDRLPSMVSGGQLQRAAIARGLINNPNILFADEPTGALNSTSGIKVLEILSDTNKKGQSILMVTHDIKAALRANRIIYIFDGMIKGEKYLDDFNKCKDISKREADVKEWLKEMGW